MSAVGISTGTEMILRLELILKECAFIEIFSKMKLTSHKITSLIQEKLKVIYY